MTVRKIVLLSVCAVAASLSVVALLLIGRGAGTAGPVLRPVPHGDASSPVSVVEPASTDPDYLVPRKIPKRPSKPPQPVTPPPQGGTAPSTPAGGTSKPRRRGIYNLGTGRKEVAITIDDGPSTYTKAILDILRENHVNATFFWIAGGRQPSTVNQLLADGNQVASHTMTHSRLPLLGLDKLTYEMAESKGILSGWTGESVRYFRPPYGEYDDRTMNLADELGMQVILWDVDSRDWALANNPGQILVNVMNQVDDGSIILFHEKAQTVQMLPRIIRSLKDAGYTFRMLPGS